MTNLSFLVWAPAVNPLFVINQTRMESPETDWNDMLMCIIYILIWISIDIFLISKKVIARSYTLVNT